MRRYHIPFLLAMVVGCAHNLVTGDPADHTISVGINEAIILRNFEGDFGAPIRVMQYNHAEQLTEFTGGPIVHGGAEAHRWDNGLCFGDARGVYDPSTNTHFVINVHYTNGVDDGYCIGVGRGDPSSVWAWSIVYWNGHAGDGARPALTDSEFIAHGIGDLLRCTKSSLVFGVPSCFWQSTGNATNVVPVRGEYGTGSLGYWVGLVPVAGGSQIVLGTTSGAVQNLPNGILPPTAFTVSAPGEVQNWQGYTFADAVFDTARNRIWVEWHGPCHVSGAHACVGALSIQVFPLAFTGFYTFDFGGNPYDSFLGSMSVDHGGFPMLTWVVTSPSLPTSMALGGIDPGNGGVQDVATWRIQHVGQGGTGYHRPDFTGVGCIPGTNQCIAHGLHNGLFYTPSPNCPGGQCPFYKFVGDIDLFNHCCNPFTGTCPQGGCP